MSRTRQLEAYVLLDKAVGETPLERLELWRKTRPDLLDTPLAYAGRLDPMASGKLLLLIGDECKKQEEYHGLDKEYTFSVLFGVHSDSGDVLGLTTEGGRKIVTTKDINTAVESLTGEITLPYPIFSSRTVKGKPLHTWTLEGRLDEIEIPKKTSEVYKLELKQLSTINRTKLVNDALTKIELIPPVTDPRKALGNDFRRPDIRRAWGTFRETGELEEIFSLATFSCIASSGTYMRSLAEEIAKRLDTKGLAFSIHREKIGNYSREAKSWTRLFT